MNKKFYKWLSFIATAFILASCGLFLDNEAENDTEDPTEQIDDSTPEENNNTSDEPEANDGDQVVEEDVNQDLAAWMPRLNDVLYSYVGTGMEYASYTWTPQFNDENYYQIVEDNTGTVMAEIYEYSEDRIVRTFSRPETYFRDNFSEIGLFEEYREEEIVLQAPIAVGTSWSTADSDYEITAVNQEVEVPAGTYDTIEVTSTTDDTTIRRYYAEDIGLVSEITETEELTIESNLDSIETETPEILPMTVYVPDEQAMGMDTVDAQLTLNTNNPARVAITELLTGQNSEFPEINILPEGTEINYLFLNEENVVEIDVSSEFENNMNVGTTGELFFVYNLVNTLSDYYGSEEVLLTVDGEPFSGPHMGSLPEGETLQYNEEMVN